MIACSSSFSAFESINANETDREFILNELLQKVEKLFDFVVLDCPPSLGLITVNAFTASDSIYVPLEAQLFSTDGLLKVIEMVAKINKRLNPNLKINGIFFTRFDRRKILKRETLETIKASYPDLILKSWIRESIALGESPHFGQDIFTYANHSAGALDYTELVDEILTIENGVHSVNVKHNMNSVTNIK